MADLKDVVFIFMDKETPWLFNNTQGYIYFYLYISFRNYNLLTIKDSSVKKKLNGKKECIQESTHFFFTNKREINGYNFSIMLISAILIIEKYAN